MTGVDSTRTVVERGRQRCAAEGFAGKSSFVLSDVCGTRPAGRRRGLRLGRGRVVLRRGQAALIAEAAPVIKSGGTIAFTDWVKGIGPLTSYEAERFLKFMKFPNIQDIKGYTELLKANGCDVEIAEDTRQFAPCVDLYLQMLDMQLTSDALQHHRLGH